MTTTPVVKVLAAWLLGVLLVAAAFVLTVSVLNGKLYSPEHQVTLYLEALRDGDGGKALGLLNASVPEGSNATLLDGEALARAGSAIEDVEVGDARETGSDRVEVPVSYTLDGAAGTSVFPLRRTGTNWGFFTLWDFEPSVLPIIQVSALNSDEASVNGVPVGLPDGKAALATFYPAAVSAEYEGTYFSAEERRSSVTGSDEPPPLALDAEPTPELTDAVDGKLRGFLDECADQTVFQPANCPFSYPTTERLAGDIDWSIEEYPAVSITAKDGEWVLPPLSGTARIDTRLRDLFSGSVRDVSERVPFEFDAVLTVTDDSVTVTPLVSY
ncbi:Uncharacterised protein [Arthrobacter agilis]|uniref:hypothetical protein n=1 Tax=Arthrobacter agilis TaxID=37921 RepID=UPI000F6EEA93|nr:hypothetical protein [Arthrobacter agilis]VDR33388.1 Uncharacterised protein [Arthrobacter agilis]